MSDDLDFFTKNLGYSWLEELKNYFKSQDINVDKLKILCSISGLQRDEYQTNLIIIGRIPVREILHKFTAKYRLSKYWQVPGESVFQLYWIDYERISS